MTAGVPATLPERINCEDRWLYRTRSYFLAAEIANTPKEDASFNDPGYTKPVSQDLDRRARLPREELWRRGTWRRDGS